MRCARCQQVWFAIDAAETTEFSQDQAPDFAAFSEAMSDTQVTPRESAPTGHDLDLAASSPAAAATDQPLAAEPAGEDIESVATRRAMRQAAQQRRWRQTSLSTAIIALAALNLGLVGWRTDVVRWLPQTASLYAAIGLPVNVRGLVFTEVATASEAHDSVQVLVVEGTLVNNSRRTVQIPRLRFALHNENGHEIYSWTVLPDREVLATGEALPFRSRLASPPPEGHQLLVRFFSRRDLVAAIQ